MKRKLQKNISLKDIFMKLLVKKRNSGTFEKEREGTRFSCEPSRNIFYENIIYRTYQQKCSSIIDHGTSFFEKLMPYQTSS